MSVSSPGRVCLWTRPGPLQRTTRIALSVLLVLSHPLWAATIIVDEKTCTLVDAVKAANTDHAAGGCVAGSGDDNLVLTTDVSLTAPYVDAYGSDTAFPVITSDITIDGNGFTIERDPGAPPFRLFAVGSDGTLQLNDASLIGGDAGSGALNGGAVYNEGTTILTNSTVTGTPASGPPPPSAIKSTGYLTLSHSSVTGNHGYGLFAVGATTTLTNSTLSGNEWIGLRIIGYGGCAELIDSSVSDNSWLGVYVYSGCIFLAGTTVSGNGSGMYVSDGYVRLTNSTISSNTWFGIQVYNYTNAGFKNTTVTGNGSTGVETTSDSRSRFENSIVAANGSRNCYVDDATDSEIIDDGNNFSDDDTCGAGFETITGLDPDLADNGGPTLTHALLVGSSAIDAAGACGLATDQRGLPRNDDACDSGPYEFQCRITVTKNGADTLISFTPGTSEFDAVSGYLSDLLADRDFSQATCLGTFLTSPAVDTLPEPPVGDGRYYLARGLTNCVGAGYGDSSLTPDPREALDLGPCP